MADGERQVPSTVQRSDSSSPARVLYFSELRALACIAVVVLHTCYCAVRLFHPTGADLVGSMVVRNCMIWAVPSFVMVTGALLLDPSKHVTPRRVFGRYLARVLVALAVFTFVFALFDMVVDGTGGGVGALLGTWIANLALDKSWLHMWYLYMLVGLYLMLPIYRIVSRHCTDAELRYLLVIYLVFQSLLPTIGYIAGTQGGFYIFVATVYPLYLFLGYALRSGKVKLPTWLAVLMAVGGTVALVAVTYFGVRDDSESLQSLGSSYACAIVVAQAAGVFALMKLTEKSRGSERPGRVRSALRSVLLSIDRCSFGIYLMHVLALYTIYRAFGFNPYLNGGAPALALVGIAVFFVTWAVVWLLKKIPGIRWVL